MTDLTRRDVLRMGAALGLLGCAGPSLRPSGRMPAVYLSHGSPMQALRKDDYAAALRRMAADLPKPRAVVIVSAHWEEEAPVRVTGSARPETIYDFYNFPDELYALKYPSPGDRELAAELVARINDAGIRALADADRGLDHGAWVPMYITYPAADVPVLEVTLSNARTPKELFRLGEALAPLRERDVLLLGSGGIVHNFRVDDDSAPFGRKFDAWVRDRLEKRDVEALFDYEKAAPHADFAVPTTEHFDPIFFVLGAGGAGRIQDIYEGFRGAGLSMRCFALG